MNNNTDLNVNLNNLTETERNQLLSLIEKANKEEPLQTIFLCEFDALEPDITYWYLATNNELSSDTWKGFNIDYDRLNSGNVYLTKEKAELAQKAKFFKHKLKKACLDSWNNSGEVLNWHDSDQYKYFISLNKVKGFMTDYCVTTQVTPYNFATKEDTQKFINNNKDDLYLMFVE